MTNIAVIVAAGMGLRANAGSTAPPKQYRPLNGRTVIGETIAVFATHPEIDGVQVVIHPDHEDLYRRAVEGLEKLWPPVVGGTDRMASVKAGLDALSAEAPDLVLIHDAARPFLSPSLISNVIAAASSHGGALPVLPVRDTVKRIDAAGAVSETLDRDTLRLAQTPQAFRYADILAAHRRAAAHGLSFTDDACVAEWAGLPVECVPGDPDNIKLTTPADFEATAPAAAQPQLVTRVGTGFDVHSFAPGNAVILGGVSIPFSKALKGHSDADVVLHALTDALLGALAEGDIGEHFPPSSPTWKDADSTAFIAFAAGRVTDRGGVIDHLDVTVLCEAPKIGPHRDAIRENIATMLGLSVGRISIKATTTERLGFAGRGEGIAASASATVRLPDTQE